MPISRKRFRVALAVLILGSLLRIAWLLKDGWEALRKVETAVWWLLLALLVLLLFYPAGRGSSDSN